MALIMLVAVKRGGLVELRDYQKEAIEAVFAAFERGVRSQLLAMATGAGKTVVFANLISRRPGRALVLAHRDRLISQAAQKISTLLPWSDIGIVMADQNRLHAPCVVASVQTLAQRRRLAVMPQFDTVIVDEAHRSAARTYGRILAHVRHKDTLLLGVTATPSRTDGIGLEAVYDEIVYQVGIIDLIERGYLAPLRGRRLTIDADFSKLKTRKNAEGINDFKADEVAEIMNKANWYVKASDGWFKYASDRRTLAFTPRVEMAHRLAEHLRCQGVKAAALDGSTPKYVQRQTLESFERGEIQFIASCDLLTEGVDLPSCNCVLFARPTKSQIVYSQAIGRGSRLSPETGKTDCLVLDLVGATNSFDLLSLGDLVGLRLLREDEEITEAKKREKKEDEECAAEQPNLPEIAEGEIVSQEVDLFKPQTGNKKGIAFHWKIFHEQRRARLFFGGRRYEVWRSSPDSPYRFATEDGYWAGAASSWEEARARVEEQAKAVTFGPEAAWRSAPASEKQVNLLRKFKIPFDPAITKGQASDLLNAKLKKVKAVA